MSFIIWTLKSLTTISLTIILILAISLVSAKVHLCCLAVEIPMVYIGHNTRVRGKVKFRLLRKRRNANTTLFYGGARKHSCWKNQRQCYGFLLWCVFRYLIFTIFENMQNYEYFLACKSVQVYSNKWRISILSTYSWVPVASFHNGFLFETSTPGYSTTFGRNLSYQAWE